jgi:DNA adenine methylase
MTGKSPKVRIANGRGSTPRPVVGLSDVRRPALRWHGGKFMLARWIISHMPSHRTYLEPFGGAASVLLRKAPSYAEVVTDLDLRLQEYFSVLRDPETYAQLKRALTYTPFHEREFLDIRDGKIEADTAVERARHLCVMAFMSHGSDSLMPRGRPSFRSSITRAGSTPSLDWSNLPDGMDAIHERLRRVTWLAVDAFDAIDKYEGDDVLVYVDPPYHRSTRSQKMVKGEFYHGYAHEFDGDAEHERLLQRLLASPSMVMLSGYRCELYDDLLAPWTRYDRTSQMDGQIKKTESLWLNPLAASRQPSPDLFGATA